MGMRDVDRREILAAPGDPIHEFLRVLLGQKCVDNDGIAFAIDQCDGISNPSEILLAGWKSLGTTVPLLGQKLPIEVRHDILLSDQSQAATMILPMSSPGCSRTL